METPQYLRRRLFRKKAELNYVGILPPLRTPHHPLGSSVSALRNGEYREGVVLGEHGDRWLVDVGVGTPLLVAGKAPSVGGRATVQVTGTRPEPTGRFAKRRNVEEYWGYGVHIVQGGLEALAGRDEFELKIATSRLAPSYRESEGDIRSRWGKAEDILVAFGSAKKGIGEILGGRADLLFDFFVNMIPGQGTETVRTEEALHATLAILNLIDE
jgi:hypothetical protein